MFPPKARSMLRSRPLPPPRGTSSPSLADQLNRRSILTGLSRNTSLPEADRRRYAEALSEMDRSVRLRDHDARGVGLVE